MRSRKRALIQLAILLANIGLVTALFKLGLERQIAAVIAGICFIGVSALVIWMENRYGRGQGSLAWWMSVLFLSISAIPIFVLRIAFWGKSFDEVGYWSITGNQLHEFSRYFYVALVVTVIIEGLRKDHTY